MSDAGLQTQWALCGIAAAAARFVPVPLLDDVLRRRALQVAVVRTLRSHGRDQPSAPLEALWGEGTGSGRARRLRALARRVLLFPVRKYTAVFGAVRGVPNDVMRVVLLARTVDRRLGRGELRPSDELPEQARRLRAAVDEALAGVDLRMLSAGLADGLSHSRGLSAEAIAFARRRFSSADEDARVEAGGALAEGADRVTEVLRRPEIAQLLERFDARVDALTAR